MELSALRRDMTAIEEGRWVDRTELPALGDMRLKVRGAQTQHVRRELEKGARAGLDAGEVMRRLLPEWLFLDIEGLTDKGKPVTADMIRASLNDPSMEHFALLVLDAVGCVDRTKEASREELAGNS